MKVSVDKDLCIGCALCESNCPEIFEMQDNIAILKVEIIPSAEETSVKQMVDDCPVTAIIIDE